MSDETFDPVARIEAYFASCTGGTADEIASHFTPDAVIWDTNIEPCRGADAIGRMWVRVRRRWGGAVWTVDRAVTDGRTAAIEWTMTGRAPHQDGRAFTFRGSEHYGFDGGRIAEIRQYWTFDPDKLDTGLIGHPGPAT